MADYWIKLYHEIIDDPKMATLPDRLWRRTIELFLLAGKLCPDKSGELPDTRQLAWLLRMPTDDLQTDLVQLASTGILQATKTGWEVVNFNKRQSAVPGAERVKQHRERKQKQEYYEGVTNLKRNVTQNKINRDRLTETETEQSRTETETTTSSSSHDFSELVTSYEKNIGAITEILANTLQDDLDEYGLTLCLDAIEEAVLKNKRTWKYIQGILRNWKRDGRGLTAKKKQIDDLEYYSDIDGIRYYYKGEKLLRTEPIQQDEEATL